RRRSARPPAAAGLGPAAGVPGALPAQRVQLPPHPGREPRHVARLPVLLHVLRPLHVWPARTLPRRRLRRRAVPAAVGPRGAARALLRRPLHCEPPAGRRALRALPARGLHLHLELQQPSEPARPRHAAPHAAGGLLADRLRHRVGLAARARRGEARGEAAAAPRDPSPDARRGHPGEGPLDDGPSHRGRGQPARDGCLPAPRAARPGADHQVHAVSGHAVLRDDPQPGRLRRGLGAHERHALGVRAARAHTRDAGALVPARLPHLLLATRRALGARAHAARRATLRAPGRDLRPRGRARLARDVARARPGVSPPRTAALVPAYNAATSIAAGGAGTRPMLAPVVGVDDGSADDTATRAAAAGAEVLRHAVNQGKGAALVTGLRHLDAAGFERALTLDADGQHLPEEIPALLAAANAAPGAIVVGVRRKEGFAIKRSARLGNWVADRFMRWLAGRPLPDTQSGFR